jgi:glutathione S-transferase
MACSLASRIALYETGASARFIAVDTARKKVEDGSDYWQVTPMGQVPALRTDDGLLITENAAVLQYLADRHPAAGLAPDDVEGRARLRQWIGFIGTELHKAVFVPRLDPAAPDAVKAYAGAKAKLRLDVLERHLGGNEFLLPAFSVADAYLTAVLNWAPYAGIDLAPWPAVKAYHRRMAARPTIARAIAEEFALWQAEQAARTRQP